MVWFVELSPAFVVFLSLSMIGTVFVLLGGGLLGIWLGLELNFFGFIPLLNGKSSEEVESCMKYFLVQSLSSGVLFMGVVLVLSDSEGLVNFLSYVGSLLIFTSLLIKVGLFPFHSWFPSVMGGSSWFNCFMLSSWQKLGVLYVISGSGLGGFILSSILSMSVLTSLVGGLGGVGQVFYRSIMSYSSLVHSGWMMVVCLVSEGMFLMYYFIYSFITFFMFRTFNFTNSLNLSMNSTGPLSGASMVKFWLMICILSLGGLPPMMGALLKLIGISVVVNFSFFLLSLLLLSSVVSLFYYLSIFFSLSFSVYSSLSGENVIYLGRSSVYSMGKISGLVNLLLGSAVFLGMIIQ